MTKDELLAFNAGRDCALRGPDLVNCHFAHFRERRLTDAWERGKAEGDRLRAASEEGNR